MGQAILHGSDRHLVPSRSSSPGTEDAAVITTGNDGGGGASEFDRQSWSTTSSWGADKTVMHKPLLRWPQWNALTQKGPPRRPVTGASAYNRPSPVNVKSGARLLSPDPPPPPRPARLRYPPVGPRRPDVTKPSRPPDPSIRVYPEIPEDDPFMAA